MTDQWENRDRFCPDPAALTCEEGLPCPGSELNAAWNTVIWPVQPDDDDESGLGDDFHGADFFAIDGDPGWDRVSHASQVAGIVVAERDNGVGVVGVCPHCTFMPVLLRELKDLPKVLDYVREQGARVATMSWGSYEAVYRELGALPGIERSVVPALRAAREAGLVLVAAAGNDSTGATFALPAGFRDVLGVGHTQRRAADGEEPDDGANCGFAVELVAPGRGTRVIRDFPAPAGADDWVEFGGSSAAAPQVAAGAALLLSVDERDDAISLTPGRVSSVLKSEATDMSARWARMGYDIPVGYDIMTGYGRLDLAASVARVDSRVGPVSVMRAEIVGLWADQWTLPAGAGPTPVEVVAGGEAGDVVGRVVAQVAEGVDPDFGTPPDFATCSGPACRVLVNRTDFPGGGLDVVVDSDHLTDGRHVLRLLATDGADPPNVYEDRVALIVDDVRIERPTWRAALRMGATVEVRGTAMAGAGGWVEVGIGSGVNPPDDAMVWMPPRRVPLADDVLGQIPTAGPIVPAAGEYTIRAHLEPDGSAARKVDDVLVSFSDRPESGWPADLGGGFWSGNFVAADLAPWPGRATMAVLRQEDPERDAETARLVTVRGGDLVTAISDEGQYPGPVCAADLDGDATDELIVLRQGSAVVVEAFEGWGGTPAGFTPASLADEWLGSDGPGEVRPNLVLADATGDGRPDIAVLTKHSGMSTVGYLHLLDASGRELLRSGEIEVYDEIGLEAVVDIDGGVQAELVVRNTMSLGASGWASFFLIFEQDWPTGSLALRRTIDVEPTAGPGLVAAAAGDLDGDELPELVGAAMVPAEEYPELHVYAYDLRTGDQRWDASLGSYGLVAPEFQMRVAVALADLDGDRRFEVIVSGGNTIHVLGPDGAAFPGWVPPPAAEGWMPYVYGAAAVADIDGDRALEFVAERHLWDRVFATRGCPTLDHGRANGSELLAWELDGTPPPSWLLPVPAGGTGLSSVPVVADLLGDGDAELVDLVAATGEFQWRGEIGWAPAPAPGTWDVAFRFAGANVGAWDLGATYDPGGVAWSGYRGNKSCNAVAAAPRAAPGRVVDLADPEGADLVVYGADPHDTLGFGFPGQTTPSLASADVSGDGISEVIVGAPGGDGPDNSRTDAGEVHVLRGGTPLPAGIDTRGLPGDGMREEDIVIYGAAPGDGLGSAVAVADVNGDGEKDLVVGAPVVDDGLLRPGVGAVYVFYGPLDPTADFDLEDSVPDVTFLGESALDFLGLRLATGDVNADGFHEIIAEAPGADLPDGTRNCARAAFVMRGFNYPTHSVLDLSMYPWVVLSRLYGPTSRGTGVICGLGTGFEMENGMQPWAAGDVNGDGLDDLLVGLPDVFGTGEPFAEGAVAAFFGSLHFPETPDRAEIDLRWNWGDVTIVGADVYDALGFQVAVADLDGDGIGDVLAGAPGGDGPEPHHARSNAGEVAVVFGVREHESRWVDLRTADPVDAVRVFGDWATAPRPDWFGHGLGSSVAAVHGGGGVAAHLVAGNLGILGGPRRDRGGAGVVHMKYGPLPRSSVDLAVSPPDVTIFGADPGDHAGFALSDGDIDGDLRGDIVVHAPWANSVGDGRDDAGEVTVVLGR